MSACERQGCPGNGITRRFLNFAICICDSCLQELNENDGPVLLQKKVWETEGHLLGIRHALTGGITRWGPETIEAAHEHASSRYNAARMEAVEWIRAWLRGEA